MKLIKFFGWIIWFVGLAEVIAINIYLRNFYLKEFDNKVRKECGMLINEMEDYHNAYEQTADKLNECNKQVVILNEFIHRDIISTQENVERSQHRKVER